LQAVHTYQVQIGLRFLIKTLLRVEQWCIAFGEYFFFWWYNHRLQKYSNLENLSKRPVNIGYKIEFLSLLLSRKYFIFSLHFTQVTSITIDKKGPSWLFQVVLETTIWLRKHTYSVHNQSYRLRAVRFFCAGAAYLRLQPLNNNRRAFSFVVKISFLVTGFLSLPAH
jgi:hypothetical protein